MIAEPRRRAHAVGPEEAVRLGAGHARATVWTNDLSIAYVHENSAYSS